MPIVTAEWVLPINAPPIHRGYLEFEAGPREGKIIAVGLVEDHPGLPEPEPGSILTPGLVNTHLHLEQSWPEPIPRLPEETFVDWLLKVVANNRAGSDPEDRQARCRFGAEELVRTGTTCVNDIASHHDSLTILDEFGLRGFVALEYFHPAPRLASRGMYLAGVLKAYMDFADGYIGHPRLQAAFSPHSPHNVSTEAWQDVIDMTNPPLIHTHAGEWEAEANYFQGLGSDIDRLHQSLLGQIFGPTQRAKTPISALANASLLDERFVLAHCVETTSNDRQYLAMVGVGVAHCPRSNLALHGKTLNWQDWKDEEKIPVGLGTDGRLSTPDLDLRAEGRVAKECHGWSDAQTLQALTWDGARVLKLDSKIGMLQPGYQADFVKWQAACPLGSEKEAFAATLAESTVVGEVYTDGTQRWPRHAETTHTIAS